MKKNLSQRLLAVLMLSFFWSPAQAQDGFHSIFDGKSLSGWSGDEQFWRVEDGAIVGQTTDENPIKKNLFLTWNQGELDDFVLKIKYRISGTEQANSGIQIRSELMPDGHLKGYQADVGSANSFWTGLLYGELTGRGVLAEQGKRVTYTADGQKTVESFADPAELVQKIHANDWNEYEITARGNHIVNKINGHVTSEIIDGHAAAVFKGVLGLQLHTGPAMKIEYKDIQLKRLPLANDVKKIVLVAGRPSHGPGDHEHNAGCRLLAKCLDSAARDHGMKLLTTVYQNGWPADPSAFENADVVVWYSDGGTGHDLHQRGREFEKVIDRGTGLVLLHYAVEVPAGESGDRFLKWIGGYFEPHWSVNPHWRANFESLPDHPVARGVKPFELNDEWYYHMRFVPEMKGVTPILTALPPAESLSRPDGPHSGNPHVRKAVLEDKTPQHVGWAYEREAGKGRGFGFTGGHFHHCWQDDNFRKVILNAIAWTAQLEVPADGVPSATPSDEGMKENLDRK